VHDKKERHTTHGVPRRTAVDWAFLSNSASMRLRMMGMVVPRGMEKLMTICRLGKEQGDVKCVWRRRLERAESACAQHGRATTRRSATHLG
jgi:hypothetical protein